jgi:hypothetical protein
MFKKSAQKAGDEIMLDIEECRRLSKECKRYAAETKDPLEKMTLDRIAREWHGLAEYKAHTKTA